jgi:threonine synthase
MNDNNSTADLSCIEANCEERYAIDERLYTCRRCGGLLDVQYDFNLAATPSDLKAIFRQRRTADTELERSGVWRFRELLPFVNDLSKVVTLAEGNTPIYEARRSAEYARLDELRFKHQGMNPTGSFKDNGMTTGVTQAVALGANAIACASTGNTSAAMAAYAARAGLRAFVFIPADQIAYGKLSQSLEYGAKVVEIEGNFDDAMRLVRELADETELYLLNSINPFRLEGQKAIIIEMMEQCGWQPPDWIVLPGGNLGNTSAFGKALHEMKQLGFIERMPRLAVIQAEGAAPFYELFTSSDRSALHPVANPATLATAIRIGNPVSWKKALRALDYTDGVVERVTEQEIADAKAIIGQDGIGCEPASAATLAGIKRLVASGEISESNNVIAVLTGNLLKDPSYTIGYHTDGLVIDQDGEQSLIKGSFANRSVRSAADKDEIKRALAI